MVLSDMRSLQRVKLCEIREALRDSRLLTVEAQAEALGVKRSTAWYIMSGRHKTNGLSANTIRQILASTKLPLSVRIRVLEYVTERAAGYYDDSELRLRRFREAMAFFNTALPPHRLERLQPESVGSNQRF
jgi:transcriptional regulator with XRE-family HTH domain